MDAASDLGTVEGAKAQLPAESQLGRRSKENFDVAVRDGSEEDFEFPTEEDLATLRRVSGQIPWSAYTIAFVELCERFSYYGTTAVFVNFIQQPLPPGSKTGAGFAGQSGALGMGQRASTGLTTFNQFWAYLTPLAGAYVADQYWGRFKTIQISCAVALVGHVILIISAIPPVIINPKESVACFSVGVFIMGIGVGGFKSNISPLIAEQCTETVMRVKTTEARERVIMDPAVTTSRVYLYFYLMINLGALVGSISMVYAEKYAGFWLAFLLPTCMLCICPVLIILCKSQYHLTPPTGSTIATAGKLCNLAMKDKWTWNLAALKRNISAEGFWDNALPSRLGANRPEWMTFDDTWVHEVSRALVACKVFLWYPVYWLANNQASNNLTSQAATMTLNGVPNDIVANFNPLFIVILVPVMDRLVYPTCRRIGFNFSPIKRITCGFFLAAIAMISATVTQAYIYHQTPCANNNASDCILPSGDLWHSNISVWVQLLPYGLMGFSEIMAAVTVLEYAFTKAPTNMRSSVTAVSLFMNAVSSAVAQSLTVMSADPLLVWNYGTVSVLALVGAILFYLTNRRIEEREDKMNMLPQAEFGEMEAGKRFGGMDDEKTLLTLYVSRGKRAKYHHVV
ncbi:uncharacterized protein L3040_006292 [Drepanopeziza brunnea f. sp. 'multigermtubi']|uniref:uncharacterized protein n=1 Tax=Drepanopeziza brunnea f. sp. 'multigermtubi' TaxID=698441 RepID=UPI0023874EFA|nr:hypothetical protein L3040_006292 [Drepanopeziza brunnea f. sp. 'multigermtubi']